MKAKRWEIDNFFTPQQCRGLIDYAKEQGFDVATLDTPTGTNQRLNYRNNDRLIFDNPALAEELWQKIKGDIRLKNPGWNPIGLNERFKIYKYTGDQFFAMHYDGSFERVPFEEQSWVTLLVYLNEDFDDGETEFLDGAVTPKTGLAALMTQHNYLHRAIPAKNGTKYVLRTDVMYRKT